MELNRVRQTPGGLRRTASNSASNGPVTQAELRKQPGDVGGQFAPIRM